MSSIYDIIKSECKDLGIGVTIVLYVHSKAKIIFDNQQDQNLYNLLGSYTIKNGYAEGKNHE